jgi:hypothetical protein
VGGDFQKARRPEIADLDHVLLGDEHVGGPQVAVDDALLVRVLDRVGDLAGVVEHQSHVERALVRDDVLQRFAWHVLHDDEEGVVLLLGGDDVDDVWMVQRSEEARLAKQLAEVKILAMRNLDGHPLVDPRVFREEHRAESAAAERFENAVLAERLTAKHHSAASIDRTTAIMSAWPCRVSTFPN